MSKKVYIKGQAHYLRPYFLDTGENLPDDSDIKAKLLRTEGIYQTRIKLPFDNRDDALEYLEGKGVPVDGMMAQRVKREEDAEGNKIITYKVSRPHVEPSFEDSYMGAPKVVDAEGNPWDEEVLIGNGSDITVKLDVWIGTKAKKVRWEGVRVDNLVPYEPQDDQEGF